MNLAVIIGVSEYKAPLQRLAACRCDVSLIHEIVGQTGKFGDVLYLDADTTSSRVKTALSQFVTKHKDQNVGEVLFYFSGHGDVNGDDFLYLLSDFDERKRRQTSLDNAELDAMLKSLSPTLAVKIVDACHSGVSYVKAADALSKSLELSKGRFKKCYFMFSSQRDQASWQDSSFSEFTRSLAKSIGDHSQDSIRYKDLADAIADDFVNNPDQTPTFVMQADLTEVFTSISPELKEHINKALRPVVPASIDSGAVGVAMSTPPLAKRIADDAAKYCTEADLAKAFSAIQTAIAQFKLEKVDGLYTITRSIDVKRHMLPQKLSIAAWLKEQKAEYFAELDYEDEEYEDTVRVPRAYSMGLARFAQPDFEYQAVTRTRPKLADYHLTAKPPIEAAELVFRPEFENLSWWKGYITWVFSKVTLQMFFTTAQLVEKNWTERATPRGIKWHVRACDMKNVSGVTKATESILKEFEEVIYTSLVNRFPESNDKAASSTDGDSKS